MKDLREIRVLRICMNAAVFIFGAVLLWMSTVSKVEKPNLALLITWGVIFVCVGVADGVKWKSLGEEESIANSRFARISFLAACIIAMVLIFIVFLVNYSGNNYSFNLPTFFVGGMMTLGWSFGVLVEDIRRLSGQPGSK